MSVAMAFAVSACNSGGGGDGASGAALGSDGVSGIPAGLPIGIATTGGGSGTTPSVGDSCHGGGDKICLGLKYVSYEDSNGKPVVSQSDAISNVRGINQLWAQCNLGFQIDEYSSVNPKDYGLNYNTANLSELDEIRNKLGSDSSLLVVTTGAWDRSGTLGNTGANAWTNMPGSSPYGAILENSVGTFSNIIAHELGHYLNLDHVSDTTDLMNPLIYDTSTTLTSSQCDTARSAATYFWKNMLR